MTHSLSRRRALGLGAATAGGVAAVGARRAGRPAPAGWAAGHRARRHPDAGEPLVRLLRHAARRARVRRPLGDRAARRAPRLLAARTVRAGAAVLGTGGGRPAAHPAWSVGRRG